VSEATHERGAADRPPERSALEEWRTPLVLLALTFVSTFWVGSAQEMFHRGVEIEGGILEHYLAHPEHFLWGWTFALPLMAILLSHEMGHYIAGKIHRVDISPPYFIPLPVMLGTMGAVIRMRDRIERRNALLDIGAAGPLAGMVVALPVLAYGIWESPVQPLPDTGDGTTFFEGHNLLYAGLIRLLKGPLPEGHDIFLTPTAFAGWAGLLVTQINLVPVGQLDGGHVAYALFGERQNTYASRIHKLLPLIGVAVSAAYVYRGWAAGERGDELLGEALAGMHWIVWAGILALLARFAGKEHPPTEPEPLTRGRRVLAVGTLILFVLLFMPSWIYVPDA
jgi:membrane-associated protease RseP (regulator of RpoE activity)